VALVDLLSVGVRAFPADDAIQFAINGNGRRATPLYPTGWEIDLDTNRDGTPDYAVFPEELGGFGVSGQAVIAVQNLTTGATAIDYYADVDFDSSNFVLTASMSRLGLSDGSTFDFAALGFDNYFSGSLIDSIDHMTYTVGSPAFVAGSAASPVTAADVPASGRTSVPLVRTSSAAPTTESGLLLLYSDAARTEAQTVVPGGDR
jgi:hypothetical protein